MQTMMVNNDMWTQFVKFLVVGEKKHTHTYNEMAYFSTRLKFACPHASHIYDILLSVFFPSLCIVKSRF